MGNSGTGTFSQSAGTNSGSYGFYLGNNAGAQGTYNLSGTSTLLSSNYEYVGNSGTGTLNQSGGTNSLSNLYLLNPGSSGTYNQSAGKLSASNNYIGNSGTGLFAQSGGTNSISGTLYLGYNAGANGTYSLGGTGQVSAPTEYIGYNSAAAAAFQQTGGTNTATYLTVGPGSQYQLAGGTLQVGAALSNQGTVNGGNSPSTLNANCLVDLTAGTWENLSGMSVNIGGFC